MARNETGLTGRLRGSATARNISPAGRRRMADAGRRNQPHALEVNRTALPALRQASAAFEAALNAELGPKPTAAQQALALAASASYSALYTVRAKLLAARRFRRVESLVSQLTALTGGLQRTLRALGMSPRDAGDDPDPQPRGGLRDYLAGKTPTEGDTNGHA